MENSIKLAILIPAIPFGITIFIFILLRAFNRTINRLTKPVSYLSLLSIIISISLATIFLLKQVEGEISLSNYFSILNSSNLEIHLNQLIEKIIIILGSLSSLLIIYSVNKLPRNKGFVFYIICIGFFTSALMSGLLLVDFPTK
tara:strand:- start:1202 stop:1633 length:432 start_codon:yes stop_codon:yes gene_type:complete